jgi:hypothetical protein
MTGHECGEILEMFGGVWPKSNTEHIRRGLYRRLLGYDFNAVRNAFDAVVAEGIPRGFMQMPWAAVIVKAKEAGGFMPAQSLDPAKLFYITCVEHKALTRMLAWRTAFYVGKPIGASWDDICTGPAERARQNAEGIYGGSWIIEPPELAKEYADDGLRGKAAREQAEKNILAGPDCAAKRWLLARKSPPKAEPKPLPPKDEFTRLLQTKQGQVAKYTPRKFMNPTDDVPF